MASQSGILRPGRTCWRIEPAGRLALIVDAADYFKAVKEAILAARHSVYLIGWDFDTRIKFEPDGKTLEGPNKLGPFLRWIDRNRPGVEVHVLKWDLGIVLALGRGTTPIAVLDWMTSERIHFRLDSAHPPGAAHHQKVVVIDDRLAFCGGIDMTADRWDTREHRDRDPRRRRPSGWRYDPWHDAATLVDGDVARALGELARGRWERAGGKPLQPPPDCDPIWPASIRPDLTDVEVGIARTIPEYGDTKPAHEIEALHLDAIAAALPPLPAAPQRLARVAAIQAMARDKVASLGILAQYVLALRDAIPHDARLVSELTQVGYLCRVGYPVPAPGKLIGPGYQGTLGYAFPTGLGAALGAGRRVYAISGDGGFGWGLQELATAARYAIALTLVVFNDQRFSNVRALQTAQFGFARETAVHNPDFCLLAQAFGVRYAHAPSPAALAAELRASESAPGPTLIEVPVQDMANPWPLLRLQPPGSPGNNSKETTSEQT